MKAILSERNIAVALFVMVFITFSLAQEDSKKMERIQNGKTTTTASTDKTGSLQTPVKAVLPATPKQ